MEDVGTEFSSLDDIIISSGVQGQHNSMQKQNTSVCVSARCRCAEYVPSTSTLEFLHYLSQHGKESHKFFAWEVVSVVWHVFVMMQGSINLQDSVLSCNHLPLTLSASRSAPAVQPRPLSSSHRCRSPHALAEWTVARWSWPTAEVTLASDWPTEMPR